MSITDELREWVTDHYSGWKSKQAEGIAIADRIDAEHERLMQEQPYTIDMVPMTDEHMAEHGWYRALCADRKPMLLGDRMEWINGTFTIHELKFTEGGCTTWDSEHGYTVHADECRHHHAPTVEDVLREFFSRYVTTKPKEEDDAIIDEYAAKLRLVEEDA